MERGRLAPVVLFIVIANYHGGETPPPLNSASMPDSCINGDIGWHGGDSWGTSL